MILIVCFFLLWSFQADAQQVPLSTVLSFSPPPSDRSIQFLGNIFGIVDGVLSGTGSQIFGNMMSVFNAAVLGLGSIVIMYTLMIGTMNTAHEGEFLGKKWSSIWIPVRCSTGMLLIMPKASGYCLMQIMMMWVVVQGVGAADRIWSSALQYLNRGGKIVQAQMGSKQILNAFVGKQDANFIGASAMLTGQVCMYATQKVLEKAQTHYQIMANDNQSGPCFNPVDENWRAFCQYPVPSFLETVNPVDYQKSKQTLRRDTQYMLPMPNFDFEAVPGVYTQLNGLCGELHWNDTRNLDFSREHLKNLLFTEEQIDSFGLSRAIAMSQMYSQLAMVAIAMVDNNPELNSHTPLDNQVSSIANFQYGVPKNEFGETCQYFQDDESCALWNAAKDQLQAPVLLAGNEFINAIGIYEGLMMPILNLMNEIKDEAHFKKMRNFIGQTQQSGWMFAGAYFFNLVNLTGPVNKVSLMKDLHSGMDSSHFYQIPSCKNTSQGLCWFLKPMGYMYHYDLVVLAMLQGWGNNPQQANDCAETLSFTSPGAFQSSSGYVEPLGHFSSGACASTVLGFIGNSYFFHLPEQAGMKPMTLPDFPMMFAKIFPDGAAQKSQEQCTNKIQIAGWKWCMSSGGLWGVFSDLMVMIANFIQKMLGIAMNILIVIPLKVCIWPQMQYAMQILTHPSSNPIVDLANMGASFIQSTLYSYLGMLAISGLGAFPMMGSVILILLAFLTPLYAAWLSYFVSIGFTTCYYIPLLPYLIFTFGVIAWLFSVIEAMVAAPIMALGITTPEGEGILGKGEHGLMLLVNVFLRPSMMVIGFIAGVALSYISIWVLNAGFDIAAGFLKVNASEMSQDIYGIHWSEFPFAQLLGCMFYVVIYISIYLTIIQKTFTLIFLLPDKVLRWIGGHPESLASETQHWFQEGAQKLDQFGKVTDKGIETGLNDLNKKFGEALLDHPKNSIQSAPPVSP